MAWFRRIIPAVKHIQSARCLIIDHMVPRPDFLLHERDLPQQRQFYLKKTPIEVFAEECKPDKQVFIIGDLPGLIPTRVGIILPLQVDAENLMCILCHSLSTLELPGISTWEGGALKF